MMLGNAGLGLVILAACLIALVILAAVGLARQARKLEQLSQQNSRLGQQLGEAQEALQHLLKAIPSLQAGLTKQEDNLTGLRREMQQLNESVVGEITTNKAIELARKGANRDQLVQELGLSAEEADTIVTFHGTRTTD